MTTYSILSRNLRRDYILFSAQLPSAVPTRTASLLRQSLREAVTLTTDQAREPSNCQIDMTALHAPGPRTDPARQGLARVGLSGGAARVPTNAASDRKAFHPSEAAPRHDQYGA